MEYPFAVQIHSGYGPLHYDLMLADGDALATWQLAESPQTLRPGEGLRVRKLPDHRMAYLSYEGPVSKDRGQVALLDSGQYRSSLKSDTQWEFELCGRMLRGHYRLQRELLDETGWTLQRLD
jgi:hypothetical protein